MMSFPDFGLMFLALLTLLTQLVLLMTALAFGIRSLLLLRSPAGAGGLRPAMMGIVLCLAVGAWSVLFFAPWRFPGARPYLWLPFAPLAVTASAAALWAMRGRRCSGTIRLMAVVAAAAFTTAAGIFLQRWDFRRESLYWAGVEEKQSAMFLAAARTAERCEEHGRRGEPCEKCKNASPDSNGYYSKEFRKYAEQAAERAKSWSRRANNR
jgi:hypothetical protein